MAARLKMSRGKTLDFSGCRFERCTFGEMDFKRIGFVDCVFEKCEMSNLRLVNAAFQRVRLIDCLHDRAGAAKGRG